MSNLPSIALASLTATYTDSENEDESLENNTDNCKSSPMQESLTPPLPSVDIGNTHSVARLVSYNDDLVVSDDENEVSEIERQKSIDGVEDSDDVQLPPEPSGRCSNELQEKIARYYDRMTTSALDMNYIIQQRKDFRNPSIYEKLIQFCSINEFGTNYSPQVYDPLRWGKESFYEELAKVQKAEMDRREKERKEKTKVEFVVGTAKRSGGSNPGSENDEKKRKSKWDQVGLAAAQLGIVKPPGLAQQSALTTSATGTKGTVISAFGSLPKKPRV